MHDILLYVRGGENEELRYAVRTWYEGLDYRNIYAVGGPIPDWFKPDIYVENPTKYQPMRQCYENLKVALNDDRLTEDVILMMDDIFILQDLCEWKVNHNRGLLEDQCKMLLDNYGKSTYQNITKKTYDYLKKDFSAPLSFEEHAPFLCNRKKLWGILEELGPKKMETLLYRSIYGNKYLADQTEYRKDYKFSSATDSIPHDAIVISTNENAFNGNVGAAIKNWFPDKSPYEK